MSAGRVRRLAVRHRRARRGVLSVAPVSLTAPTRAMTSKPASASRGLAPRALASQPAAGDDTHSPSALGLNLDNGLPQGRPVLDDDRTLHTTDDPLDVVRRHDPGAPAHRANHRPCRQLHGEASGDLLRIGSMRLHRAGPQLTAGQSRICVRPHRFEPLEEAGRGVDTEHTLSSIEHDARRDATPRVSRSPWDRRKTTRSS